MMSTIRGKARRGLVNCLLLQTTITCYACLHEMRLGEWGKKMKEMRKSYVHAFLEPIGAPARGDFHFICLCQVAEPEVTCIVRKKC